MSQIALFPGLQKKVLRDVLSHHFVHRLGGKVLGTFRILMMRLFSWSGPGLGWKEKRSEV
jgi:hypothetical protein